MSVGTQPTNSPSNNHVGPADPPRARPSAGGSIFASVVAGAMAALLLSLFAFAGDSEATITGAMLLGFGFGWALMATWTVRHTWEPQRWAVVPAVVMGVTGAALIALRPGNAAMTALNWVWPPLLLALAGWMAVRIRRSVSRTGRWMLAPVVMVLALASIGATYANISSSGDLDRFAAPGKLYDVGGHDLHLDCRGDGSPTVVLFNGLGEVSASWARIAGPMAPTTRICAYDRAGQGWSEDADHPEDGIESARDLHTLLTAAGEEGPYVLVGHSTGGAYAMTYAARYPDQVAGLVLLDSSSPEQFTQLPDYPAQYAVMRRGLALLPTLHRVGLGSLLVSPSHLPPAQADRADALTSTPRAARNGRDELSVIRAVFTQAQALTTLDDRPLAVLTASESNRETDGWAGAQDQLAALSTNRIHRTIDSSHTGLLEDAEPAAASVRAISQVISSVRNGTPLPS